MVYMFKLLWCFHSEVFDTQASNTIELTKKKPNDLL